MIFNIFRGLGSFAALFHVEFRLKWEWKEFFSHFMWRKRSFWFMATLNLWLLQKRLSFFCSYFIHFYCLFVVYLNDVIDGMNDSFWSPRCTVCNTLFSFACSLLAYIYYHLLINLSSPTLHFSIHYLIVSGRQFSFSLFLFHRGTHTIPIHLTIQSVHFIINVGCWKKNHKFIMWILLGCQCCCTISHYLWAHESSDVSHSFMVMFFYFILFY